jgi:uncharacterized spore protein YtfJ
MEEVTNLVQTTLAQIEKLLSTKAVVGEPVTLEGKTFVPLIAVGFAFGAGGGAGKGEGKEKGEGGIAGTAGGGGVKPVAVIVADEKGVRVEAIRGPLTSVMEKFVEEIPVMMDKCSWRRKKED